MKLILHPRTELGLKQMADNQSQAVLIAGAKGSGKAAAALYLAQMLLRNQNLENYPYLLRIAPANKTISIDEIRSINDFLKRKTVGKNSLRRVIIIEDADTMTTEAQNSLLKNLEEPPADTAVILTASDSQALLATIRSRVQTIEVLPLSLDVLKTTLGKEHEVKLIEQAYYISDGRAGLALALLDNDQEHELLAAINEAKNLLKANRYERLALINQLNEPSKVNVLLEGLLCITKSGLKLATSSGDAVRSKTYLNLVSAVNNAQKQIAKNVSTKLVLTNLFLSI